MNADSASIVKETLDDQCSHWDTTFLKKPDMFGEHPSDPAQKALELFQKEGLNKILEFGAGQGRDTLFFARSGLQIHALDYAESAIKTLGQKAQALGLSQSIKALRHDVRDSLPFDKESFDGCYSHMLYCMAFTTRELEFLSNEVRRVLRPGGINVYSVRHTNDPDYGTGMHRGEDMYEVGGFIVHFFSREKVEHLAKGWDIVSLDEFEEGKLPRKLFRVTLRKKSIAF